MKLNSSGRTLVVSSFLGVAGALQWIYQTGTSGTDFVRDAQAPADRVVVLDQQKPVASSGDIVIAGSSTGSFGGYTNAGEYDMLVMNFAMDIPDWDRWVESSGKILAAGHSQQSFQGHTSAGDYDMVVMELNSAGALQWSFQTGTTRADYALAMQVESSGDIVIAGETAGSFAGYTNAGEYDMVVMKIAKELGCLTCTTSETTTGSSTSSTSTASSSWTTMTLTPGSLQTIAAQLTEAVESLATHQAEFAKQMLETATDGLQREMQDAQGISMVSVAFEIAGGDVMLENENISVLLPAASLPRLGEVAVMSTAKVTGGSMLAKLIQAYNEATAAVQLAEPVSLHVSAAGQSFASAPLQLTMPITHGSELEEKACVAWDARLHAWTTHGVALSASDHYFATCSIWLPSPESPSGRRLQTLPPSLFGLIMPSNLPPAPAEEVPWALVLSLVAGFAAIVAGLGVWKLRKTLRARGSAVEPATGCCDTGERSQGGEQESGATSTQQGTEKTVKPQARLAMVSARFNSRNKEMEEKFRRVCRTLRERDLEVLMVQAGAGEDFARKTMGYLHRLQIENGVMLAVCTTDYAEMTESQYSSHAELQYALDNRIDILPLKVEDTYPPEPPWGEDHPFDKEGVARVLVRLAMRKSTVFVDCVGQAEDYIADEIERVLRPSSQLIRGRSGHGAKSESALAGESE
ncbi:CACNA1A [Symbiodinium natans]|uniref:CACNA1A protein n=1 Tax=Symbiodinium natans TaxID=878477 RepID=A0A812MK50_9DINO|nr:CACNA1A [Symbiodinium natans]